MGKLLILFLIYSLIKIPTIEGASIVGYRKLQKENPKIFAHILEFSPSNFAPKIVLGGGCSIGLETVFSMAKRTNAIAAINGGFYKTGLALGSSQGLLVLQKNTVSTAINGKGAIGWSSRSNLTLIDQLHGKVQLDIGNSNIRLNGYNVELKPGEINLYSSQFSRCTLTPHGTKEYLLSPDKRIRYLGNAGNSEIPQNSYILSISSNLQPLQPKLLDQSYWLKFIVAPLIQAETRGTWENFEYILQAGPLLLKNYNISLGVNQEPIPGEIGKDLKKARTAIGIKGNGSWLIFVAEASSKSGSEGLTLPELAKIMKDLGCKDAVNLDGGGSSTLVYEGTRHFSSSNVFYPFEHKNVLYIPKEGDRPVGNGIIIVKKD